MSPTASSATLITLDRGALATTTPARVAAATSTLSKAGSGAGHDAQPGCGGEGGRVDPGAAADQYGLGVRERFPQRAGIAAVTVS
ncbi:hypothetical protein SGLAM104S_04838 [Streptomyces glaucescens]